MKKIRRLDGQNMIEYLLLLAVVIVSMIVVTHIGSRDPGQGPIQEGVGDIINATVDLVDQGNEEITFQ